MADINTNAEGSGPVGTLHVKILPDFDGFTEALEEGLRDAEESTSPLLAVLARIEDHLRVIADGHRPVTIGAAKPSTTSKEN